MSDQNRDFPAPNDVLMCAVRHHERYETNRGLLVSPPSIDRAMRSCISRNRRVWVGHNRTKTTLDKPRHSMDDPPHVQKAFSGSAHSRLGQSLRL